MDALSESLLEPRAYPHRVEQVRLVETHISRVFLAGDFAYKLKKPVYLGFLDFRSLEARRHFCFEELRLNRRFAPGLYLDVVAIVRGPEGPRVAGEGEVIDFAVRMRRFPDDDLLAERAAAGRVPAAMWTRLGTDLARLHRTLARAPAGDEQQDGVPPHFRDALAENFRQCRSYLREREDVSLLNAVEERTWADWRRLEHEFWRRHESGAVRECHGDLHLGNLLVEDGRVLAFDCVEFNSRFRWIDVASEMAFLVMDCEARGVSEGGFLALNAWLEESGDYGAMTVFDTCRAYRAMVRAKVALLAGRPPLESGSAAQIAFRRYLSLADRFGHARPRFLAITCGVSGSGKSTVALRVAAALQAVRIRADVERKRLFGLAPDADTRAPGMPDIYTREAGARTFARLEELATTVLEAGHPVVLDATFIRRGLRERFRVLAERLGVPFRILHCDAPPEELHRRVALRLAEGQDASEADEAVLVSQLAACEPPSVEERVWTLPVGAADDEAVARLATALRAAASG
jgi:aminoglycoside phosphotransferase family enzyme/predicted kinase